MKTTLRRWSAAALAAFATVASHAPLGAHDEPAQALRRLDGAALAAPDDPRTALARGEYLRLTGRLEEADEAARAALLLGADTTAVQILQATIALDAGRAEAAILPLSEILARDPDHRPALLARARAWKALDRPPEAFADLRRFLTLTPRAGVERWLECAELRRKVAPDGDSASLALLEEAIAELGPVPLLLQRAARLETEMARYEAALSRLDRLPAGFRTSGRLWLERALVWEAAGRPLEAGAECTAGLDAIAALPPERRGTPAARELELALRSGLARAAAARDLAARDARARAAGN